MNRRAFISSMAGGLLAAPLAAKGQPAEKIYKIGWLGFSPNPATNPDGLAVWQAFLGELRKHGWVEGQNIVIERRYSEGQNDRFPTLAAELIRLKVDVIVPAVGPVSLIAASAATKTIPIVMVMSSSDPVGQGYARSLAHPGGNITGISAGPSELWGKRLQLLKEAFPVLSRVGYLWDAPYPFSSRKKTLAPEESLRSLGIEPLDFEVHDPSNFDHAVQTAKNGRVGALVILGSPFFFRYRRQIADVLTKQGVPAISEQRQFAEAGLLMTYGASLIGEFRRAAYFVDKILKGAKPTDLPIEQPTEFELVINLKTAKALGLTIPPSLLLRADEVIR